MPWGSAFDLSVFMKLATMALSKRLPRRALREGFRFEVRGPAQAPATVTLVTRAAVTSDPGENGALDTGKTVEARVQFSGTVSVAGPPGTGPKLAILLDGERREARYTGGGGTRTLTFGHEVTAADDGAALARVEANGLVLDGTVIVDGHGRGGW